MKKKKVRNLRRQMTLYFPAGMEWLRDAIDDVRSTMIKEGVEISQSDVICSILSDAFASSSFREQSRDLSQRPSEGVATDFSKILRSFSDEYRWLGLLLEQIVQTKLAVGIKTSVSREVCRLAVNALREELRGASMDIEVIKEIINKEGKDG